MTDTERLTMAIALLADALNAVVKELRALRELEELNAREAANGN